MRFLTSILMKVIVCVALTFSYVEASLLTDEFEVKACNHSSTSFTIPGKIVYHTEGGKEKPTLFLCHGGPHGSIRDFENLESKARFFDANIVAFDYRGSLLFAEVYKQVARQYYEDEGLRDRFRDSVTHNYAGPIQDLQSVLTYVEDAYKDKIDLRNFYIAGGSYGGFMAIMAAVDPQLNTKFRGMVAISAFYGLGDYKDINCPFSETDSQAIRERKERVRNPFEHVGNIRNPLLIIHGGAEDKTTLVSRQRTEDFIARIREEGKGAFLSVLLMDQMKHADDSDEYERQIGYTIAEFIAKQVRIR